MSLRGGVPIPPHDGVLLARGISQQDQQRQQGRQQYPVPQSSAPPRGNLPPGGRGRGGGGAGWQSREAAPSSSLLFPAPSMSGDGGSASPRVSSFRAPPGLSSSLPSSSPWAAPSSLSSSRVVGDGNGFVSAGVGDGGGRRRGGGRQRSASLDALWLPEKVSSPSDPLNVVGSIFTSTTAGRRRSTPAQAASVALPSGLGLADAFRRQSDPLRSAPFAPGSSSSSSASSSAGGDVFATELVGLVVVVVVVVATHSLTHSLTHTHSRYLSLPPGRAGAAPLSRALVCACCRPRAGRHFLPRPWPEQEQEQE